MLPRRWLPHGAEAEAKVPTACAESCHPSPDTSRGGGSCAAAGSDDIDTTAPAISTTRLDMNDRPMTRPPLIGLLKKQLQLLHGMLRAA